MIGASPKGLSEDGTHLIVVTDDGQEFRVAITDELRAWVRHARVVRTVDERPSTSLSPREIQQRIRAGLNAAELAELTGEPIEALAKFEAPVLAERAYIVELARATRIGRGATSPTLADLVDDRLLARGVDPVGAVWDAWRELDEPWKVAVDFRVAGRVVRALWTYDHVGKALTAEDEESAWLTETELLEAPIPRRHLAAVRPDRPEAVETAQVEAAPHPRSVDALLAADDELEADDVVDDEADPTEALLEDLAAKRGTRQSVEIDEDDVAEERFEGFGPARAAARRQEQPRHTKPAPGPAPLPTAAPDDRKARKGRASVPSWDEIVFGTKND